MANTVPFKTVFAREYQRTHYKQAVFPAFADQRFEDILEDGASVKWSYDGDSDVQEMGSDGSYTVEGKTVTDETITVDQRPTSTFRIPVTERIQDHRPTQEKWSKKAANRIFWSMDADMLGAMKSAATSDLDAGDFGGSDGTPVTVSSSNAAAIFAAARRQLRNQNVIYDSNKQFKNVIKYDQQGDLMPVAAIPAELEEQLLLQIGFKNSELGDTTLKQGYLGLVFGFNTFVSTALPFSFKIAFSSTPTDGSTITIAGVTITWETGTIDVAGEVKAETSATVSCTNLVNFLNDPYASISAKSQAFVRSSLTLAQRFILDKISAVDNLDGSCVITILGAGNISVSQNDAAGTISNQTVHAIFGTSRSIALIMQRAPEMTISAGEILSNGSTGGYVAKDFVGWSLAGWKVFNSQTKQLVNVKISSSSYGSPSNVYN